MKVLGVTPLYPPMSRVGAWLSTHECLKRLAERGHEVKVRTALANLPHTHEGIDVAGVGSSVSQHLDGVDVVVSHLGDEISNAGQAARHAGVLHVVMVHGQPTEPPDADLVVFNSESTASVGWDVPSIVVRPHVRAADHETTRGDAVTLVNCMPEKGAATLDLLAALEPDREFLAVKGGYGRQRPPSRPNVTVHPTVEDMRAIWSQTRVLLMPSERETWGRVAIEAMCSGIPVIAHPTPGLLESLGDAGIFVDRMNLNGWRSALRSLDDPDAYEERSRACRERAHELNTERDLDVFCDAMEALCVS